MPRTSSAPVHRHGRRRAARPRKVEVAPLEEVGGRVPRVVDVERRAGAHGDVAALEERTVRPSLEDALDDAEVHRQLLVGVRPDKATRPRLDERVALLQREVRRRQRLLKATGGPFLDHDGLLRAAHRRRDRQRQHPDCLPHLVLPVLQAPQCTSWQSGIVNANILPTRWRQSSGKWSLLHRANRPVRHSPARREETSRKPCAA